MTVTTREKNIAKSRGLSNVAAIATAANKADVPFHVACALMEMESHGKNVYGHDVGGVLSGFPEPPNEQNFKAFWHMVNTQMFQSNGVGPAQITSRGLLQAMISEGLKPWDPADNMFFGIRLVDRYHTESDGSWRDAGTRYNGSSDYGDRLAEAVKRWKTWLAE